MLTADEVRAIPPVDHAAFRREKIGTKIIDTQANGFNFIIFPTDYATPTEDDYKYFESLGFVCQRPEKKVFVPFESDPNGPETTSIYTPGKISW